MKSFDPYPSISVTAPAPPEKSELEGTRAYGKQVRRWREDNAKWRGQRKAVEQLELHPHQVKVPEPML